MAQLYIPSYTALRGHPKVKRLARSLGVHELHAVGHLHYLWWWAMDYAPDGNLSRFEPWELAEAMAADDESIIDILVTTGFLDRNDGQLTIHDWDEYGGKVLRQRAGNAQRQATHRTKKESNSYVTVTSQDDPALRNAPDKIRVDKRRIDKEWQPTAKGREYAIEKGMREDEIAEQVQFFIAHHDEKKSKLNWDIAWQRWCRNFYEWYASRRPNMPAPTPIRRTRIDRDETLPDGTLRWEIRGNQWVDRAAM